MTDPTPQQQLLANGFAKIIFPTSEPREGMMWSYDIETDAFYEIPSGIHEAASRAFNEWSATATSQTPSSPEMRVAYEALKEAIKQARSVA